MNRTCLSTMFCAVVSTWLAALAVDVVAAEAQTLWGAPDLTGSYVTDFSPSLVACGPVVVVPPLAVTAVRIAQSPGLVTIHADAHARSRVIPTNDDDHPVDAIKTPLGMARGEWDSGALIITTTNPSMKVLDALFGTRTVDDIHFIERLQLLDRQTLQYDFTVSDPAAYAHPWSVRFLLKRVLREDSGSQPATCPTDRH